MFTPNPPKNTANFECEKCRFKCTRNAEWNRHIFTRKHLNVSECLPEKHEDKYFTCECGKMYNYRQSLYVHRKTCQESVLLHTEDNMKKEEPVAALANTNQMIELLIKENSDFKGIIVELVRSNADLQKQMLEICKSIQPSLNGNSNILTNNSNNNSHNKTTFNMQVFLNETCKDAMNMKEFVDSIKPTLSDLEMVGEKGLVEGTSDIILKSLRAIEVNLRPIHCSDAKREVMYVKDDDKWEKDGPRNDKVRTMVKNVEYKNIRQLTTYGEVYPDSMDPDSPLNDQYLHLSTVATSGTDEHVEKIVTRLAKEVVVDK
jgi:hypothetical protein